MSEKSITGADPEDERVTKGVTDIFRKASERGKAEQAAFDMQKFLEKRPNKKEEDK